MSWNCKFIRLQYQHQAEDSGKGFTGLDGISDKIVCIHNYNELSFQIALFFCVLEISNVSLIRELVANRN